MPFQIELPRAILFDVGNTVLEERRFDLEAGISAVVGKGISVDALAKAFRSELAEHHRHDRELLLAQWLRERVPALAPVALSAVEDSLWNSVVTLVPRPGVADVLRRLSDDRVLAAAVSNAAFSGRVLRGELARHGLADAFRFVLSSADVFSRKPSLPIFETALRRLGVSAAQTWFVGDTFDEDIVGAKAAGLQPIWFSNGAPLDSVIDHLAVVRDWTQFLDFYNTATRNRMAFHSDRSRS